MATFGSERQRDKDKGKVDNRYQNTGGIWSGALQYGGMLVRIPVHILGRYKKEKRLKALWGSHNCHSFVTVELSKSG